MPHSSDSNYIKHAVWDVEEKRDARLHSIIKPYQKFWHRSSIPIDRQYWTMCGARYNEETGKLKGELGHMLEHDLIHPNQFYGVDCEDEIIEKNKFYYPHINWIHGDFIDIMQKHIKENNFNPAIINYDGVMMSRLSSEYLKKLFILIDKHVPKSLLLICSFVVSNPYNPRLRDNPQDPLRHLNREYWIADHWFPIPEMIPYKHSTSNMLMMMWIKRDHDVDNIKVTSGRVFEDWINEEGEMT